jgi:hypothetical protein
MECESVHAQNSSLLRESLTIPSNDVWQLYLARKAFSYEQTSYHTRTDYEGLTSKGRHIFDHPVCSGHWLRQRAAALQRRVTNTRPRHNVIIKCN